MSIPRVPGATFDERRNTSHARWRGAGGGMSAPQPHPLLVRLGPGAVVAADLRCPNFNCRDAPVIPGSVEVVNEYGVKDPWPRRCPRCGVLLEVARLVDLEAAGGAE